MLSKPRFSYLFSCVIESRFKTLKDLRFFEGSHQDGKRSEPTPRQELARLFVLPCFVRGPRIIWCAITYLSAPEALRWQHAEAERKAAEQHSVRRHELEYRHSKLHVHMPCLRQSPRKANKAKSFCANQEQGLLLVTAFAAARDTCIIVSQFPAHLGEALACIHWVALLQEQSLQLGVACKQHAP